VRGCRTVALGKVLALTGGALELRLPCFVPRPDALVVRAGGLLATAMAPAARTGHLTSRACAEIAAAAGIRQLVPFHFSRRYQERLGEVYAELRNLRLRWRAPQLTSLRPITPTMMMPRKTSRGGVSASPKNRMPMAATPTAPRPVQTA
jgi:hypothetical protein